VAGHEGTCTSVTAGTEVSGSCPGPACGTGGSCNAKNGTACSSASACASGFCADGVCCESACDGLCASCNQTNRAGKCSAYAAGSDPEKECGLGSGLCRSTCNGAGACDYPQDGTPCGTCKACNGAGACFDIDPSDCANSGTGGVGGFGGGTGGTGGFGGTVASGASGGGGASGFGGMITGGGGGRGGGSGAGGATSSGSTVSAGGAIPGGTSGSGGSLSGGADGGSGASGSSSRTDGGRDSISPDMGNSDSTLPDAASVDDRRDASPPDAGSRLRLVNKGCDCSLGHAASARPAPPFVLLSAALLLWRLRRKRWEQRRRSGESHRTHPTC
jgi:hypothetical protein